MVLCQFQRATLPQEAGHPLRIGGLNVSFKAAQGGAHGEVSVLLACPILILLFCGVAFPCALDEIEGESLYVSGSSQVITCSL